MSREHAAKIYKRMKQLLDQLVTSRQKDTKQFKLNFK